MFVYTHAHTHIYVVFMYLKIPVHIKFLFFFWQILKNALIKLYLFLLTAIELLYFSPGKKTCIGLDVRLYHQIISYTDSKKISHSNSVLTESNSRAVLLVARARAGETSQQTTGSMCFWRTAIFRQGLPSIRLLVRPIPHCTARSTD